MWYIYIYIYIFEMQEYPELAIYLCPVTYNHAGWSAYSCAASVDTKHDIFIFARSASFYNVPNTLHLKIKIFSNYCYEKESQLLKTYKLLLAVTHMNIYTYTHNTKKNHIYVWNIWCVCRYGMYGYIINKSTEGDKKTLLCFEVGKILNEYRCSI